ncbi:MAG: copper homeostasis protein CutC [Flavobacteriales bacterium]|jgi:copper homeostasis protein|nr:copper homeostasis protein CutC [Flavobacteriales bacterium]QQS73295.1 MAG: copper homeostasis protein CutC [Flavobacteriales bacterium]HQV38017.1 copper homeostasis protein CutC [Flavobacteriales bacterium]HQW32315.1 copper homeostasis protein CutC [Flavobacteriales bacterium]HQY02182.1 copper homeostasis protein CutC [Flavobacteriales bacterium]
MLLEVCAYSLSSCRIAREAGADRVELCSGPLQGGTTPSWGMITAAMELGLPVFPMIRPRGGDFIYNSEELDVMWRDIRACRELGCPGIVAGAQRSDGSLDVGLMKRIVQEAGPMAVTCHKVFDQVPDPSSALEVLIEAGCARVLTSGLHANALEGARIIKQLVAQAAGRIVVMPGGGVRSENIAEIIAATGATEYHSSAITANSTDHIADPNEVQALVQVLRLGGR